MLSIESSIAAIEQDISLLDEMNFNKRSDTIDFIEFNIIGQLESLVQDDELVQLKSRAEKIRSELEAVDNRLFERLRSGIKAGEYRGKAFRDLINEYFDLTSNDQSEEGYDNLDIFINRLLSFDSIPEQTRSLESEMVYYQKTPTRLVFELAERIQFTPGDVFVDIGSGLGQAGILINLLTGCKTTGIEFEPAFCNYAKDCANWLNLTDVSFTCTDARKADYSEGTIFFMYTPFRGEMLRQVLELLWKRSLKGSITIITYGPCTAEVSRQSWLRMVAGDAGSISIPAIFCSC